MNPPAPDAYDDPEGAADEEDPPTEDCDYDDSSDPSDW